MTISNTPNKSGPYFTDGVTITFPFEFKAYAASDIAVYHTVGGVTTLLAYPADYALSGIGADGGGAVTTTTTYPHDGGHIDIIPATPFEQPTSLPNQGAYLARTVERALDRTVMMVKRLAEQVDRSLRLPVGANVDGADIIAEILGSAAVAGAAADLAQKWAENPENSAVVVGRYSARHWAAKAAASAAAAATFDPATYYPKWDFRSDATPNAPMKYGVSGDVTARNDVRLVGDAGTLRMISWCTGWSIRWNMGAVFLPEAGGNTGSDFAFTAFSDSGAWIGDVFTVARSTRQLDFKVSPSAPTPATYDSSNKVATTAFVTAFVAAQGYATAAFVSSQGYVRRGASNVVNVTGISAVNLSGVPSWALKVTLHLLYVRTAGYDLVGVRLGAGGIVTSGYAGAAYSSATVDAAMALVLLSNGFTEARTASAFDGGPVGNRTGMMTMHKDPGSNGWVADGAWVSETGGPPQRITGRVYLPSVLDTIQIYSTGVFNDGYVWITWE